MSALKDIYSPELYQKFAETVFSVNPEFKEEKFIKAIFSAEFKLMELKERMRHTTKILHDFFPGNFKEDAILIDKIIDAILKNSPSDDRLPYLFFPDYIETYGIDDYETSIKLLEKTTQFITCEYAVRPFILKYPEKMLKQMLRWSSHKSHHVRRLASESSRPRLPWAMGLPFLKKNPEPILPILENLKNDSSEYVRRSVANNLNDIAKDHPEIVLDIAKKWRGTSKETDALVKHGCRTLLKQGHPEVLSQYGLHHEKITVGNFKIETPLVKVPESVVFSFTVENNYSEEKMVRLEYGIYYNKANGQLSKKVFKISERVYLPKQMEAVMKKQSFKIITTKKFYAGLHKVSVIVNGVEKEIGSFELTL